MSKYLVIVESPTKAKTIGKFLGRNYKVVSCMGHIRDLPKSRIGVGITLPHGPVDIDYITIRGKGPLLKELKKEAAAVDKVLYASDPDREGEAIAWHLKEYLEGESGKKTAYPCRVEFNEITKETVKEAVKHPRAIDINRFEAQQCRRVLDRMVGYEISPLLWKKIQKNLSAGRVQSVAVRMICERQDEIDAFDPEEFWTLEADFLHGKAGFGAKLQKIGSRKAEIKDSAAAAAILKDLGCKGFDEGNIDGKGIERKVKKPEFTVTAVTKKEKEKAPQPPFTTSSLQQEANSRLGFTAARTMQLAQQLYEGISINGSSVGLITYMRTDSVRISDTAHGEALSYIGEAYGKEYCPGRPRQYAKGKRAQDAHEAIRPTSVMRTPTSLKDSLSMPQYRLYKLIWERFVASQMVNAKVLNTVYDIKADKYLFKATGNIIVFPGYTVLSKSEGKNERLPELKEGEVLDLKELLPEQHFTQAPPAYTEAGLIKTMEKLGIGRPSTYASIVETIVKRGYVSRKDKTFHPTYLGKVVNKQLVDYFPNLFNIGFTADMEEMLDKIEAGEAVWEDVILDFYGPFKESLVKAEELIDKDDVGPEVSEYLCDKCGKHHMVYKISKYGRFLACPGYPECRNIISVDDDGKPVMPKETGKVCELCGKPMIVKKGKYGEFLACSDYPACKNVVSIDEEIGIPCPECGGELVKRRSKRGKVFYGCKNFPDCEVAYWNKPTGEKCPDCGHYLVEKPGGDKKIRIVCENKECSGNSKKGKKRKTAASKTGTKSKK